VIALSWSLVNAIFMYRNPLANQFQVMLHISDAFKFKKLDKFQFQNR